MAQKLPDQPVLVGVMEDNDIFHVVDASATTGVGSTPEGTSKKANNSNIKNIYNANGTLTGDRTVSQNLKKLSFVGGNIGIGIIADVATAEDGNVLVAGEQSVRVTAYQRGEGMQDNNVDTELAVDDAKLLLHLHHSKADGNTKFDIISGSFGFVLLYLDYTNRFAFRSFVAEILHTVKIKLASPIIQILPTGNTLGAGKVLTDVNGDGNATWQAVGLGGYRNFWIDAATKVSRATNGAALMTEEHPTNDIMMDSYLFDGATPESVQFKMNMPDEWNLGTVKAKFYWDVAAGGTGNVIWGIRAGALGDGLVLNDDIIDSVLGTEVQVTDTAKGAGRNHITSATDPITIIGNPTLGKLCVFQISRRSDLLGDTINAIDCKLLGISIQYRELSTQPAIW